MINRFVKLHFREEEIENFKQLFNDTVPFIRNFDGCEKVELLQDVANPAIFFTHSVWESETHLNAYRNSELFQDTWAITKTMFQAKPNAWSLNSVRRM